MSGREESAAAEIFPELTRDVIARMDQAESARLRDVMEIVIRHLHAIVREAMITQGEWAQAIDFLTRANLMRVLERPEIPLHNNAMESDIREFVKRRKISGGTRSDAGRRCRDTFASLKKTCRKLGIRFWDYLQDRIRGLGQITRLADLIRQKA